MLRFASQTVSPETAAVEWFLIMNLLLVHLSSLQSIMHFDCALYAAAYSSQMHGAEAVWMLLSIPLSFTLT